MTILDQLAQPLAPPVTGALAFDGGEVRWDETSLTFTVPAAGLRARLTEHDPGSVQLSGDTTQRLLQAVLRTRDGRRLALVAPVDGASALDGLPPVAADGARVDLDALLELLRAARQRGIEMAQVQVRALAEAPAGRPGPAPATADASGRASVIVAVALGFVVAGVSAYLVLQSEPARNTDAAPAPAPADPAEQPLVDPGACEDAPLDEATRVSFELPPDGVLLYDEPAVGAYCQRLTRIDARTGARERWRLPGVLRPVGVAGGRFWAQDATEGLVGYDPDTGERVVVQREIEAREPRLEPEMFEPPTVQRVEVEDDTLWIVLHDGRAAQIDAKTLELLRITPG